MPAVGFVAVATFAFLFWRVIAGGGNGEETPRSMEAAAETAAAVVVEPERPNVGAVEAAPVPQGEKLPYSVAIASYSSYDDAAVRQQRWNRPDLTFYVAPTPVRGVVYYRVFAGTLADRQQAEDLMAELVREGIKDTVHNWDVRPARYAFSFGTFNTARDARAVVEMLSGHAVPAYIVPTRLADAGSGYHVYAGGYESEEDARLLRERIAEAGLELNLVERVGVVTQ